MRQKLTILAEGQETGHAIAAAPTPAHRTRVRRRQALSTALPATALALAAYAAYERVGTSANADSIEYTQNLSGGFLAVGMTKDQPGFIVMSDLDREKVEISAVRIASRVAGTHTVVNIQTPRDATRIRLRGPVVIVISRDGAIERHDVDWMVAQFNDLREAADCSHAAAVKKRRCGEPFADLHEALASWPARRVPRPVRAFLEPFRDRRSSRRKGD